MIIFYFIAYFLVTYKLWKNYQELRKKKSEDIENYGVWFEDFRIKRIKRYVAIFAVTKEIRRTMVLIVCILMLRYDFSL